MLKFYRKLLGRTFLLAILIVLGGCSGFSKKVMIGRDVTWFPYQFGLFTPNVNAFVNVLSDSIGKEEHFDCSIVNLDWVRLKECLNQGQVAGIFTCTLPGYDVLDYYEFSDPLLLTGPVLVVKKGSTFRTFDSLNGKTIGAYLFDSSSVEAQQIPDAVILTFDHIPNACEELLHGKYDAILIPALNASNLISTVYQRDLDIVSEPLTSDGIRLMVVKDKESHLIRVFNRGLTKLKNNGEYAHLKAVYEVP